ncbi:MAG: nitroreductase [Methyloceanibacter sp.]
MELLEAIKGRRAVRDYTGEDVADAKLRELIDAAIHAPSAMNQQPWSFVIVKNQALLAEISGKAKAYLLDASLGTLPQRFCDMLSDPKFHIFYHAPVLIVIAVVEPTGWAIEDCALAAQNLMLAAHAAGLGTCWIGFAQGWLGTADGKSALGLPASHVPVAPIIVGHPKHKAAAVPRKEPELRWIE